MWCDLRLYETPRRANLQRQKETLVARGQGRGPVGKWGVTANRFGASLGGHENVLGLAAVVAAQPSAAAASYTLGLRVVWYVSYVSRKLLF